MNTENRRVQSNNKKMSYGKEKSNSYGKDHSNWMSNRNEKGNSSGKSNTNGKSYSKVRLNNKSISNRAEKHTFKTSDANSFKKGDNSGASVRPAKARPVQFKEDGKKSFRQDRNELQDGKKNFRQDRNELQNVKKVINNGVDRLTKKAFERRSQGACPYIRECGGCSILRQTYEAELKEKQKTVEQLLNNYCKVEPILGMKEPKYYRNKVHVVFDHDKKGNPVSGVYEEGTHRVIPVESCLIHNQKADAIIATIRGMLKSFKIKTYDEDTGYGLLRHVLVRTGYTSGEIMVVLVLSSPILPSKNNFVKALREAHPEITTVVINVNDKKTSMVLGEKEQVIYGKGYIEDRLCGKVYRISPKSFYQVNPSQTEVLYNKAIEMAGLTDKEKVVDAYCGIGTIGLIASDHAKEVIGVELNKDAVHDAVINAKLNDVTNIEFYSNDAGVFMSQMAMQKETVDVVFMDPPRSGSSEQFLDSLVLLKPRKVVYISCNPVTLERDLKYLTTKGYKAVKAVPVDMFPWTEHVETIIMMTKCGSEDKK